MAYEGSGLMIVLAWIAIVAVALFSGASFWAVARAPAHLLHLLNDPAELSKVVEFLGSQKLLEEAQAIEPVFGSYAKNIANFNYAYAVSLRTPRNLLVLIGAGDLVASYFVSPWCLITTAVVLVLPALFSIPASAINNNVNHIYTILLNLINWHQEDGTGCEQYCTYQRPELSKLHCFVVAIRSEANEL